MKTIKLTYVEFNSPVYINPDNIEMFLDNDVPYPCTCIFFTSGATMKVKESVVEINNMLLNLSVVV